MSPRRPLVAGNWKMNTTPQQGAELASDILNLLGDVDPRGVEAVVCPPFTGLMEAGCALENSALALGAQDIHPESHGAYTGGISGQMLVACGCSYVLVGHSERRLYEGETVAVTAAKLRAAHRVGLIPVLCVGESVEDRQAGRTPDAVLAQLSPLLEQSAIDLAGSAVVAYEPVWAIGSGAAAEPADAAVVARLIRRSLEEVHGKHLSGEVRLLYGGSVSPQNISTFLDLEDLDGVLVGGASLRAETFAQLVRAAWSERP